MPTRRPQYLFVVASVLAAVYTCVCSFQRQTQSIPRGEELIRKMWKKHKATAPAGLSFTQRTFRYDSAGKLIQTSVWYEKIKYPDKFRIDTDTFPGNSIYLWRNDSFYLIRRGVVMKARHEINELLLILGGMYRRDIEESLSIFKKLNYDLAETKDTVYCGVPCRIIGKINENNFWIEKKNLLVKRIISKDKDIDGIIDSRQKIGKTYVENKLSFYSKGRLVQREEYYDVKTSVPDESIFGLSSYSRKN